MTVVFPYKLRAFLYVLTAIGTPVVAYLFARGIINGDAVTLWSAEVAIVASMAAINTSPSTQEKIQDPSKA